VKTKVNLMYCNSNPWEGVRAR